jgi:hypothetical protein
VRADFQIMISEDGVSLASPGVLSDGGTGSISYSGMAGDFSIAFTYTTNSPGADSFGFFSTDSLRITNRSVAEHTLTIAVSSSGFNTPLGGPLTLVNSISGTVTRGTLEGNYTSYADRTGTLFGTSDLATATLSFVATTVQGFVDPDLAANQPPPTNTFSTSQDTTTGTSLIYGFGSDGTYSVTSIGNFDLYAGSSVTVSELSGVHAPAPPGLVLALSGIPVLGLGSWFRARRKQP